MIEIPPLNHCGGQRCYRGVAGRSRRSKGARTYSRANGSARRRELWRFEVDWRRPARTAYRLGAWILRVLRENRNGLRAAVVRRRQTQTVCGYQESAGVLEGLQEKDGDGMKRKPSISHDEAMAKELRENPEFAVEYLRAALEEGDDP